MRFIGGLPVRPDITTADQYDAPEERKPLGLVPAHRGNLESFIFKLGHGPEAYANSQLPKAAW